MAEAAAARVGSGTSDAASNDSMELEDPDVAAAAKRKAEELRTEGAAGDGSEGASTPKAAASSAGTGTASSMTPLEVQQRAKDENDRQQRALSKKATEVLVKRARTRETAVLAEVDLEERAVVEEV